MGNLRNGVQAVSNGPTRFAEDFGIGSGSVEATRGRPASSPSPLEKALDGGGWLCGGEAEFLALVEEIRTRRDPADPIEGLMIDRLIQAAWRLRKVALAEEAGACDEKLLRYEASAERSLFKSVQALEKRRDRRDAPQKPPAATARCRATDGDLGFAEDEDDGADAWRGRLIFDPGVSDESPVVRGTWITVNHVISLIVDGWTWPDILRSHPELNEDDLRACLSYHVHEESHGPQPMG